MRSKHALTTLLILSLITPLTGFAQQKRKPQASRASQTSAALPPVNYTEFRLENGLRVIFHEDHSTPIVGVNVWYHVGSKNEVPGKIIRNS